MTLDLHLSAAHRVTRDDAIEPDDRHMLIGRGETGAPTSLLLLAGVLGVSVPPVPTSNWETVLSPRFAT